MGPWITNQLIDRSMVVQSRMCLFWVAVCRRRFFRSFLTCSICVICLKKCLLCLSEIGPIWAPSGPEMVEPWFLKRPPVQGSHFIEMPQLVL